MLGFPFFENVPLWFWSFSEKPDLEDSSTQGSRANNNEQNDLIETRNAEQNWKKISGRQRLNEQSPPPKQWGTQTTMNKLIENNQENVPETFKTLQKLKNWQRRRDKKKKITRKKDNHKTILCNRKGAELPTLPPPQVARTIRITKPKSEPRQDQKEIPQRKNIKHKGKQEDSRWTTRTYKPHHNHNKHIRFPNKQLLQRNLPDTVAKWVF